jgi:hypothetical protein
MRLLRHRLLRWFLYDIAIIATLDFFDRMGALEFFLRYAMKAK